MLVVMFVMPMDWMLLLTQVFTVITVTGMLLLLLVRLTSNRTNHYDHPKYWEHFILQFAHR